MNNSLLIKQETDKLNNDTLKTQILDRIDEFCSITIRFSMRLMHYDQTVGLYSKNEKLIYQTYITGCLDFVSIPRGVLYYSLENTILTECVNIHYMIQNGLIPFKFIKELNVVNHDSHNNGCNNDNVDNQGNVENQETYINNIIKTKKKKNLFKMKRSNGKIQYCVLGSNNSIFLKSVNYTIHNESNHLSLKETLFTNSDIDIDYNDWRVREYFNCDDNDITLDTSDNHNTKEQQRESLEYNYTDSYKCIYLKEFCDLNGITKLTIDYSSMIIQKNKEQTITQYDLEDCALNNKFGEIDLLSLEYLDSVKLGVVDEYNNLLKQYIDIIQINLSKHIEIEIT